MRTIQGVIGLLLLTGQLSAELVITQYFGSIRLDHYQTEDHCAFAPQLTVDMSLGDSIVVIEHDQSYDFADCICTFDLSMSFPNPEPGDYTIYVFRSYEAEGNPDLLYFQDSISLTITSDHTMGTENIYRSDCFSPSQGSLTFPLAVGNTWYYRMWDPYSEFYTDTLMVRVEGDTTMDNGQEYARLSRTRLSDETSSQLFWRMDSIQGIVYQYDLGGCEGNEWERFDLNYSLEGPYQWHICEFDGYSRTNYLSELLDSTLVLDSEWSGMVGIFETFQDSLGLTYRATMEVDILYEQLIGWIIDGEPGGTLLSHNPSTRPTDFYLSKVYPNPFNPETHLDFELNQANLVSFRVYDLGGSLVWYEQQHLWPGKHKLTWPGRHTKGEPSPSGLYFFQVQVGDMAMTRKAVLSR